jgi:hypothetical protein
MDDYAKAFGLAGEEAAAGIEEAGRGLTHPLTGLGAGMAKVTLDVTIQGYLRNPQSVFTSPLNV